MLRSIDDVVPGAAREIVAQAHANMESDRNNEARYVSAITKLDLRGQWMGYSLAVLFGLGSYELFMKGIIWGGVTMGIAAITPLVRAFLQRGTGWSPWTPTDQQPPTDTER